MRLDEFVHNFKSSEWRFAYKGLQLNGRPFQIAIKKDKSQIVFYTAHSELRLYFQILVNIEIDNSCYNFEAQALVNDRYTTEMYQYFEYLKNNEAVFINLIKMIEEDTDDKPPALW